MQVQSGMTTNMVSGSVLRAAQQQPHLAADLISKTVESLAQAQSLQISPEIIAPKSGGAAGAQIDIRA